MKIMATATTSAPVAEPEVRDPWLPMIVIAMAQMLMSFNVSAIPVSMGGMVESFQTPPTTVGTAVVLYSLGVSGFIMLGAKLGQRFGSKIFFQAAVALLGVAMALMVLSPGGPRGAGEDAVVASEVALDQAAGGGQNAGNGPAAGGQDGADGQQQEALRHRLGKRGSQGGQKRLSGRGHAKHRRLLSGSRGRAKLRVPEGASFLAGLSLLC
jgi:Major Facilitator Superfamily